MIMALAIVTLTLVGTVSRNRGSAKQTHTCIRLTVTALSSHSVLHKSLPILLSLPRFRVLVKADLRTAGHDHLSTPNAPGTTACEKTISSRHLRLAHPSQSYLSPLCQPIHPLLNAFRQHRNVH